VLRRDEYSVLIIIDPKWSMATYFDSGSETKKDYSLVRSVLDEALECYADAKGPFKKNQEFFSDGKHKFKHVFQFPCVKQPAGSLRDAFYVLHHLKGWVRDCQMLTMPSAVREWAERLARINDDDLREDFHDSRVKLAHILNNDVLARGGTLNQPRGLCKREIEGRLKMQGDRRTWTTKELYKPFPEPCEKTAP